VGGRRELECRINGGSENFAGGTKQKVGGRISKVAGSGRNWGTFQNNYCVL